MGLIRQFFLILLINLVHLISNLSANEVSGCGGFIKSHAELDFSKVEVGLFTSQGSLKIKTDCSPSNGYYFIPMYDKGDYLLKVIPPHGWSFEPQKVLIKFDGINDDCSLEKDVNFVFKGFGITGKIGISGKPTGGAKGVKVELRSEKGEKIGQTLSDNTGVFSFTPIVPGKYFITVSHEKWHFLNSEITVVVETGNTEIPSNLLVVSGYDVVGKVLTDGQPFGLVLFNAKGQKPITKCSAKNIPQLTTMNEAYDSEPLCYTTNKMNGEYVFNAVSPGKYLIAPHYDDNKNIKFHIKPEFIEIEVLKDALKVSENFEVTGFSVSGRVLLSPEGHGVYKANVRLNGRDIAATDENGQYTLENIQAGTYTIQVSGDEMEFKDHTVRISLANPTLPDIVVSGFKVCGQVISKASQIVAITKEGSTFHTEIPTRDNSGEWCIYLANGHYLVQVLTSENDKSKGVQFFPLTQKIEVNSSPVSGIIFSQLRATVRGIVQCLPDADTICSDLTVTLNAVDVNGQIVGQPAIASLTEGAFSFVNVLPGNYEISVPKSKLCWERHSFKINIKSAEESVPTFVQTGYIVSIVSSHLTTITYKFQDSDEVAQTNLLNAGLNSFCVLKAGTYDIKLSGCHRYDSNVATTFWTKSQSPLNINAYKHKNVVRILSNENVGPKMDVLNVKSEEVIEFTLTDIKDGHHVYQYDFYLENDESVELHPQSEIMLFKPENRVVVGGNDCVDGAFNFIATKGLLIIGNTVPAIGDVKVTMIFPKNPELSSIITTTDDNGQFKFGPINANLNAILTAEKESYVFSEFDSTSNTFRGHKLCEIIVNVVDEFGKKLSGVLLTLSGGESYRKNLVTSEDGIVKFHSLSPSQYYLKAMMKEYKFEPNSKMIDVQEGATVVESLKAIRVAFSIFGAITTLNREPFPNVIVEAVADEICNYHQEETTSEPNGHYRIRGLQPGCEYKIHIKIDGILVDRSIPIEKSILVGTEDIRDVNMIAISPLSYVDVAVRIKASQNDFYKSLKIVLYKKGTDTPVHSQRVESPINLKSKHNTGIMVLFPRIPFDRKTYYIELTTSLSDKTYKFSLPVVQFTANTSNFFAEIEFKPEIRSADHDLNQNSLSAIILIAVIGIIFFKQDMAIDVISLIWTKITNAILDLLAKTRSKDLREEVDNRDIDQLASCINAIKKKKTKKVN